MKNSKKTTRKRTGARSQKAAPLSINPAVRPSKMARRDPFHAREAERYENPLPSREYILATLKEQGVPVTDVELHALLGIRREEVKQFNRRLAAMEREGQIMRNRREAICVVEKLDLVAGRVQGHPDGFGFLVRDDKGSDLRSEEHTSELQSH